MKTINKRLFSFVMALAMVLSCTMVASAAELNNSSAINESVITSTAKDYSDSTFSTQDMQALTDLEERTNLSKGQTIEGDFIRSISSMSNITIVIRCDAACTVTIKGFLGTTESKYIPAGGGTYTICSAIGKPSYEIRFHSAASAAIFQFFTTDGYYDG